MIKNYFYSEKTKKTYNTEAEALAAEEEFDKKELEIVKFKEERARRAKEVEEAYKKVDEAKAEADKLMKAFLKDYKTFHTSITTINPTVNLGKIVDAMFNTFPW